MTTIHSIQMSDGELLSATVRAAGDERRSTAVLLALLAEVDARRLYLGEGCSSLFTYCTQVLHLSEHAAYHRIEAARTARSFPLILGLLVDGSLTLTTVALLRAHLTEANHETLLAAAQHKSKREVEHLIAGLAPKPDAKPLIRKLPAQTVPSMPDIRVTAPLQPGEPLRSRTVDFEVPPSVEPRTKVAPLSSDRYLLRVTLSAETHAKLKRAQQLMSRSGPDGDPAVVIDKALSLLVEQLERAKIGTVRKPRACSAQPSPSSSGSRHIPASIRRQVWARDEGRCAFVAARGRCSETTRLEFHHLVSFARGGPTTIENVALRCRAHNAYESEQLFGSWPGRASEASLEPGSP